MITTKNRVADLRRTCKVLKGLSPTPFEILITADGCTDDTVDVVRGEIPSARLIINENGRGSVASRDRMMREAVGDLVLALDDDSYPEQVDCLAHFANLFDENPKLAVAHFPQRTDEYPESLSQSDFGSARPTGSFANSGAVLRRSIYVQLSGFEPTFFHMYEEPDYALQCIAAGFEVVFTPVVTIRHHFSGATRDELRNHHRHSRNELRSVLLRCPFPQLLGLALYRIGSQFWYACKRGTKWVVLEPVWWWQAMGGVLDCAKRRRSIPWLRYRAWLKLQKY